MNKIYLHREPIFKYITWTHSSTCNFNCSYCTPFLHDNKHRGPKEYNKFIDFFNSWANNLPVILDITGGEPTLWPEFENFCNDFKKSRNTETYISFTTNGSRSINYWKNFNANVDIIGISFHFEFADLKHTIEVIKILLEKKYNVELLLVTQPEDFEKTKEIMKKVSKLQINAEAKIVYDNEENQISNYTDEMLKYFKDSVIRGSHTLSKMKDTNLYLTYNDSKILTSVSEIKAKKENTFYNWKCFGGEHNISVRPDGTVYGAECGTWSNYPLGNIYEGNVKIPNPIKCKQEWCNCGSDISIKKKYNSPKFLKRKKRSEYNKKTK